MSAGRVDVILPLHRGRRFVLEAIESVRAQRLTDWRLWVVEDACPERSLELVEKHFAGAEPRIETLRLGLGRGAAAARNFAAARGCAPWIAFLDQDDRWHPRKLERQIAALEARGGVAAHTDLLHMDATGRQIAGAEAENRARAALAWEKEAPTRLEAALFVHNRIRLSSAVVARERFARLGGFDELCFGGEDWAFWVRLAGSGARILHIAEPLLERRYHGANTSIAQRVERRKGHFEALRRLGAERPHLRLLVSARLGQLYRKHVLRELRAGESGSARALARQYIRERPAEPVAWLLLGASCCAPLGRLLTSPREGGEVE